MQAAKLATQTKKQIAENVTFMIKKNLTLADFFSMKQ